MLLDDRYAAIHRVGITSEGYTYDLTARAQKQFNDSGATYASRWLMQLGLRLSF